MCRVNERDIETVASVCGVSGETAMVALQFARGNLGVEIDYAKNNIHLLGKNT